MVAERKDRSEGTHQPWSFELEERLELVESLWESTRPEGDGQAERYREALKRTLSLPKMVNYRPFYVFKENGGQRQIFAADNELRLVQEVLASWITRNFPLGDDYCYLGGRGVLPAVQQHQEARFAYVFDLQNAFESVTDRMVKRWLSFYQRDLGERKIDLMVDLLTVDGRARQGCVSTPYVYNLVVQPLDGLLALLSLEFDLVVTRYSDNICLSSTQSFDFDEVERRVGKVVKANGFDISWSYRFTSEPIAYLGTRIDQGKLSLDEEKYGEFCWRLLEVINSPTSEVYRAQMTGIFTWAYHICGEDIPGDLLRFLGCYFGKVGRTPGRLADVLARRHQAEIF